MQPLRHSTSVGGNAGGTVGTVRSLLLRRPDQAWRLLVAGVHQIQAQLTDLGGPSESTGSIVENIDARILDDLSL